MELPPPDAIRPPRRVRVRRGATPTAPGPTTSQPTGSDGGGATPTAPPSSPLGHQRWWRRHWKRLALAVVIIVLAAGAGGAWAYMHRPKPKPVAVAKPKPKPKPAPIYSPLTGLPAANAAAAQQPVVGVMIENLYPNARPQSGLGQAGVVYEALAEGGITRFLAVFQELLPPSIGPVRSLRPYYLDWGLEYGIPVAHAGGSEPALNAIPGSGLKDINALAYDGNYFYRTTDRYAPHNLYTNNQKLAALLQAKGFATPPSFAPLPRKADKAVTPAPHPTIKITFSSSPYNVEYDFNAAADDYLRVMGGVPHVDRNSGAQIQVKNVVLEYVPTTYGIQLDGKPETNMNLIGSGQAVVFEDGTAIAGTWNKASDSAPTKLLDTTGKPIMFNRGNTWYDVIPVGNSAIY